MVGRISLLIGLAVVSSFVFAVQAPRGRSAFKTAPSDHALAVIDQMQSLDNEILELDQKINVAHGQSYSAKGQPLGGSSPYAAAMGANETALKMRREDLKAERDRLEFQINE